MKKGCLIALGSVAGLMLLGVGSCIFVAVQYEKEHPELAQASAALTQIETEVMSYRGNEGLGSSEQSRVLAKQFALGLQAGRQVFFTGKDDSKLSFTQGHFVTYCSLSAQRCVFIVHVPQLRNYTSEAETAMSEMAWRFAVELLRTQKIEVKELAVGTHGVMNFGKILIGQPSPTGDALLGVKQRTTDGHALFPFLTGVTPSTKGPSGQKP